MNRSLLPVICLAVSFACSGCSQSHPPNDLAKIRPKVPVVLIVIDTLRVDHVGIFGYGRPTTPNIDSLAREGLRFERTFAQSSWTKPTTASILTGQFPAVHGVMQGYSTLPPSLVTLAEALGHEGYGTAAVVANGFISSEVHGFRQGFDLFEGGQAFDDTKLYPKAGPVIDHVLLQLDALQEQEPQRPVFLYVHLMDPHTPYDPPSDPAQPWRKQFEHEYHGEVTGFFGTVSQPGKVADLDSDDLQHLTDLYDAEIAYADAQLGRLFNALKERGLWTEALVIVLADHGEEFMEHGSLHHGPTLYQELVHIPLLIKPPAALGILPDQARADTAMQIDVVPTVLGVIGSPLFEGLPGRNLLATSLDPIATSDLAPSPSSSAALTSRPAFGQVDQKGVLRNMVIAGDHKLIHQVAPTGKSELYDLDTDPHESNDLSQIDSRRMHDLDAVLATHASSDRRRTGFALEFVNQGAQTLKLEVRLGTRAAPIEALQPRHLELASPAQLSSAKGSDSILSRTQSTLDGAPIFVTSALFQTIAGDRDGLEFVTSAEDAEVFVDLFVNGNHADLERIFLGSGLENPSRLPVLLHTDDSKLIAPDPSLSSGATLSSGEHDHNWRIHVWHKPNFRSREASFDDESLNTLRQIGYFGGETDEQ